MAIVYLNGDFAPRDEARVSADDRGFTFGDGVYEGVRAIAGRRFAWDAHMQRLAGSLDGLRIRCAVDGLDAVCDRLLRDNDLLAGEAFLYIAITRGAAPRVHGFPAASTAPTVYVTATPFTRPTAMRDRGAAAITHEDLRWARCDLKTLNVLGNVLARQAASEAGAFEAILVRDGVITEGAATAVFAVIDGEVRTHPLSRRILPSVTRAIVLELARAAGIAVREDAMSLDELRRAEEIFVCGTTTDVTPIVSLDGAAIAAGVPGPIARRLRAALEARLDDST